MFSSVFSPLQRGIIHFLDQNFSFGRNCWINVMMLTIFYVPCKFIFNQLLISSTSLKPLPSNIEV